jgi:multiple sugar transport system substrate-binding protein
MTPRLQWLLILLSGLLSLGARAQPEKQELLVSLLVASGEQRAIFHQLANQFERQQPGVQVRWIAREDARYKELFIPWLKDPDGPDVVYWQAGTRLRQIAQTGYLAPIDDIWEAEGFDSLYPASTREKVSYQGRTYALPYSYYQWGFYYRKSIFEQLGLQVPTTWKELLGFCANARQKNIAPVVLGSRYHWPVAAWFDYLNLRLNGLAFHREVVAAEVAFTDPRIRRVFEHWKTLLDADCFIPYHIHTKMTWRETLPYLYRGMAATTLSGNFIAPQLSSTLLPDFGFFPFPRIDNAIGHYEEAPTDVFALPSRSANNAAAKAFIAFMGQAEQQSLLNNGIGNISTNPHAKVADRYFLAEGKQLLQDADGLSDYFDRDATKELAEPALAEFRRFMSHRDIDQTLQHLENVRQELTATERRNSPVLSGGGQE